MAIDFRFFDYAAVFVGEGDDETHRAVKGGTGLDLRAGV